MSASTPNPRYFNDANGLKPNWRFAAKHPRRYLWLGVICRIKPLQMALIHRWDRGEWLALKRWLS